MRYFMWFWRVARQADGPGTPAPLPCVGNAARAHAPVTPVTGAQFAWPMAAQIAWLPHANKKGGSADDDDDDDDYYYYYYYHYYYYYCYHFYYYYYHFYYYYYYYYCYHFYYYYYYYC